MIRIVSFGQHRRPPKAREVFDCRSLPNPHRLGYLRDKTGLDEVVRDYVRSGSGFMALVDHAVAIPAKVMASRSPSAASGAGTAQSRRPRRSATGCARWATKSR